MMSVFSPAYSLGRASSPISLIAGFAVFRSPLKDDSEPALRMLRESQHQLIMITGVRAVCAVRAAFSSLGVMVWRHGVVWSGCLLLYAMARR